DASTTGHYSLSLHAALPIFRLIQFGKYQQSPGLSHSFNLQHSRHYRFLWEVTGEVWFVGSDVLHPHNEGVGHLNHLVHHQEGVRSEEHTSELQSRENLVCRL